MKLISAGLLMYSFNSDELMVFLVHPGGPFFESRDNGIWSIPKGLVHKDEDLFEAAVREFNEETGITPNGHYINLDTVKLKSGKIVYGWAFKAEYASDIVIESNTFSMKWPPIFGKYQAFPECDMGKYFNVEQAKIKINPRQIPFIERLEDHLKKN
ncbi:MAG: NUDIX domain-containing protein [Bacteroidota bacterium]|nr:NUDIX domain-containing protein [Bacteroidota bacterium]